MCNNKVSDNIFEVIGSATIDIEKFKDKKVICILVDMKIIMEAYAYGTNIDLLRNLL